MTSLGNRGWAQQAMISPFVGPLFTSAPLVVFSWVRELSVEVIGDSGVSLCEFSVCCHLQEEICLLAGLPQ